MLDFYKDKRVFITGHTGFKGTWLSKILINLGAKVTGYSLENSSEINFFKISNIEKNMNSIIGDIRDLKKLEKAINESEPEIIFHLAAQPLVRESYENPHYTYETNVMGTVNILECIRKSDTVKSFLNVTTDKVYENNEWVWGYRENETLNGYDPYSNSKSCSELVTSSYLNSFFRNSNTAISTARAGNVIGGGDFSKDRIVPDCVHAAMTKDNIIVRNPNSIRPYQHVLDPLYAYMLIAQKQYQNPEFADNYNVGPDDRDCITTGELSTLFCKAWGEGMKWDNQSDGGPHEATFLKLDCSNIKNKLGWKPKWHIEKSIQLTVEWSKSYMNNENIPEAMDRQINEIFEF